MTEFHDSAHKERGEVMDPMEQIRQDAGEDFLLGDMREKVNARAELTTFAFSHADADMQKAIRIISRVSFQAGAAFVISETKKETGAQALLHLLGRSATSEGHPPRIMMTYKVGGRPQVSTQPRMDCENHEYLSRQEHEALRAADLLEVERLKGIISKAGICEENYE